MSPFCPLNGKAVPAHPAPTVFTYPWAAHDANDAEIDKKSRFFTA